VQDISGLLQSIEHIDNHTRKVALILDWILQGLPVDGVALMEAPAAPASRLSVCASRGALSAVADRIAGILSQSGLPRLQGMVALPAGLAKVDAILVHPVNFQDGVAWSALLLHGANVEEAARTRRTDLLLVASLLRDALENERLKRETGREKALAEVLTGQGGKSPAIALPGLALLSDGLRLPLYMCDEAGAFLYASPAFLGLTGYPSLEALTRRKDFFADPKVRAEELQTVRSEGMVTLFPLSVNAGTGARLELHDSVVSLGQSFFGSFDVTAALIGRNAELKDSLQIQELLNDSIIAGTKTLQRTKDAAIRALARLAEYRDPETGFHLQRICEYTRLLAFEVHERAPYHDYRISREYGDDMSVSSMLHDIGKVSIPDSILLKPGKLDSTEWELMKKHTIFGWEVLHKADMELGEQSFLTLAASIALSHHERFDGSGYPNGTAGDAIPLSGRISAVADVYDALTTARPYKEAWSHERARDEIVGGAGSHFDPVLVDIFRDVHGRFAEVRQRFPG
jgi:HD-GYP domain-containing protein (c-di-GMP phosphodiesterase class II)